MVRTPTTPQSDTPQSHTQQPDNPYRRSPGHDPTKMINQPALNTSSGRIWLIMGAFFMVASLIPLGALVFIRQGPSMPLASVVGIGVIGLYVAMIGARLVIKPGAIRLRILATLMIAMAALALFGILACSFIERQAVGL